MILVSPATITKGTAVATITLQLSASQALALLEWHRIMQTFNPLDNDNTELRLYILKQMQEQLAVANA